MKHSGSLLLAVCLGACLSVGVKAQAEPMNPADVAAMARVKARVDEIETILDRNFDVGDIPASMFSTHYQRRQVGLWPFPVATPNARIDDAGRLRRQYAMLNFYFVMFAWAATKSKADINKMQDETAEFSEILPKDVIDALSKSRFGRALFSGERYLESKTDDSELENNYATIHEANRLLAVATNNARLGREKLWRTIISGIRSANSDEDISECDADDCKGLPFRTKFYSRTVYPLYLSFIRENGDYKIIEIRLMTD